MKKKIITVVLIIAMVATLCFTLIACKPDEEPATGSNSPIIKEDPSIPADFKIGVIHIGDPADGSGYSYTHDQGIVGMQVALGLTDAHIIRELNVKDTDAAQIRSAIQDCITKGAKIVFGTSFGYMDTMAAMANEFPNVIFSHATGYKSNATNMNNYFGKIYQARYLAGIAAGLKTKSNKIGYVAAFGTELAETCSGINAFALGAKAANPNAKVLVKTLNSWFDPANETAYANALLDLGCDVITQHCDTPNPQLAAQAKGAYGCGYNNDMTADAPQAHLTAAVWNWEVYYTTAVAAAIKGREYFMANIGNYYGGLAEGFVDVSPATLNCSAGTKSAINQVKALMVAGSFNVFEGNELNITITDGKANIIKTPAALGFLVKDHAPSGDFVVPNFEVTAGATFEQSVINPVIQGNMNVFVSNVEKK